VEEVKDREQLSQVIDEMLKKAQPVAPANSISPKKGAPKKARTRIPQK
jgi:hypothetical protein